MRIPKQTTHANNSAPDVICALGRGIERVQTSAGERWRPTRYIEAVDDQGRHTGYRKRDASMNDNNSLIAGANANVLALCERWKQCRLLPHRLPVIVFAAGRPAYLSRAAPLLTEGFILSEVFRRRARAEDCEMVVLAQNRNTKDDIFECARLAAERKLRDLEVITVSVHVERVAEFVRLAQGERPQLRFHLLASEDILRRRYARFMKFEAAYKEARASRAYLRTAAREAGGIEALRAGRYRY